MPSRILMPVAVVPGVERRLRQRLAGGDAFAQRRDVVLGELAEHRAIGGRRGEADRGAELARSPASRSSGRRAFQQHRGGADAQREQHEPAEPEGEGERRRADEAVVALRRAARGSAVAVADRQHVAMEMHRALRLAGGAGGEGDQADVVARGVAGGELLVAGLRHQRFERVGRAAAPVDDALELAGERLASSPSRRPAGVAERERDLRLGRAGRRSPWRAAAAWSRPRRRRP